MARLTQDTNKCTNPELASYLLEFEMNWFDEANPTEKELKRQVARHLDECSACRGDYEFLGGYCQVLREHPDLLTNPAKYIKPRPRAAAAFQLKPAFAALTAVVLVVALLAVGYFYRQHTAQQKESMQYAQLAEIEKAPADLTVVRGQPGGAARLFNEGMVAYQQSDYLTASEKLAKAVATEPENAVFHYYLGICYLMLGKYDPAITSLETSNLRAKGSLQEDARWYLGQAYLKVGRGPDARRAFESIAVSGSGRKAGAERLLEKMKKLSQ